MKSTASRPLLISLIGLCAIMAMAVLFRALPTSAAPAEITDGALDWGIKESFRAYIEGPIAHGETVLDGATENADGTFNFPLTSGTTDNATNETEAAFGGSVNFSGHDEGDGPLLDLDISALRLEISGTSGTIIADITSKALDDAQPVDYDDVVFVTLNFTGIQPAFAGGNIVFTDVPATLTEEGAEAFAGFYPEGTAMDPVTITLALGGPTGSPTASPSASTTASPSATATTPAVPAPKVQLSRTTVNPSGDTITVTGTGFLPSLATGTRPPLAGVPGGVYIAFGAFADTWEPSKGAPAASRPSLPPAEGGLLWAVPEASRDIVGRTQSVTLNPDGSFTAVISVRKDYPGALADGNYGIYTYPGSGAVQPLYETFTPVQFSAAPVTPTKTATAAVTTAPKPPATGNGLAEGSEGGRLVLFAALVGVAVAGAGAAAIMRRK